MSQRAKNRIVISLDQQSSGQPRSSFSPPAPTKGRRRRWPKVLAILALLCGLFVLLFAAGGYLWWRNYQTRPAYSLALIIDAAQRNDIPALKASFDDQAVARNLVGSVREKAGNRYGISLSNSLQSRIDSLLPTLLARMNDTIYAELAKEIKDFSSRAESKPFVVVALAVSSFVTITTEGDNARVVAPLPDRVIELYMRRDGNRWKVIDFKDEVLVQRVVDALMKDLPAIGGVDLRLPVPTNRNSQRRRRNR